MRKKSRSTMVVFGSLLVPLPAILGLALLPTPAHAAEAPPVGQPEVVEVGAVPITIYEVDLEEGTYFGSFYVWYRWSGSIDPTQTTEIANIVERWGTSFEPLAEKPIRQPDGSRLQTFRLDGRFDNNFNVARFPLDTERLNLTFENTVHPADELIYQPAPVTDLVPEDDLHVQGWTVGEWSATADIHDYNTRFGDSTKNSSYSSVTFSLGLERPTSFFVWKLLLPLLVVLIMGLVALLVEGSATEVRIALPTTAILAAVFLQFTYTEDLPTVTGLVLMDALYVIGYIALTMVLCRVIYASYSTRKHQDPQYSTKSGDLATLAATLAFVIVGMLLCVIVVG